MIRARTDYDTYISGDVRVTRLDSNVSAYLADYVHVDAFGKDVVPIWIRGVVVEPRNLREILPGAGLGVLQINYEGRDVVSGSIDSDADLTVWPRGRFNVRKVVSGGFRHVKSLELLLRRGR